MSIEKPCPYCAWKFFPEKFFNAKAQLRSHVWAVHPTRPMPEKAMLWASP